MTCKTVTTPTGTMIVCLANIYKYKGIIFENHYYCGPLRLRNDLSASDVPMGSKFYDMYYEWKKLSEEEREKTRIEG